MQRRIESEGWGAIPRRLRQFMDKLKTKTPKEWIAERKWREFLGAIPADGKTHTYIVPHPNDLMTIRVTATQVKSVDRWYGVEIDLVRKTAKIIVNPKTDGRSKHKKV